MVGKVWGKSLTFDPYGSKKTSPKCYFEDGKFKLRSLRGMCCILKHECRHTGPWLMKMFYYKLKKKKKF